MPEDLGKKIRNLVIAGAALAAYLLLRQLTGFSVPCAFHAATGLKCPGCGVTRMLTALMHLDIKSAYEANPFLLVTSPFIAFELIYEIFVTNKKTLFNAINTVALVIFTIALLTFGVFRNLDQLKTGLILLDKIPFI